jgi:vacuolar-type H+-ATPase subunit D/Vma8
MSVWRCKHKCIDCPTNPKSCIHFDEGRIDTIRQACISYDKEPNYAELIGLQSRIFPVILDIKKETKHIHNKDTEIDTIKETLKNMFEQLKILQGKVNELEKVHMVETNNDTGKITQILIVPREKIGDIEQREK